MHMKAGSAGVIRLTIGLWLKTPEGFATSAWTIWLF
jgi:hypothetical protein